MSDHLGIILVKDINKFIADDKQSFISYFNFDTHKLEDPNIIFTDFDIREDSKGIRLRNIINGSKPISDKPLPRLLKKNTIINYLQDTVNFYNSRMEQYGKNKIVQKYVKAYNSTIKDIQNNPDRSILIGIW